MLRSADNEEEQAKKLNEKKRMGAESETQKGAKQWAEAVAEYDWDYVASESLLHFAEVYTGVLPSPRRVRGPLGWIAHLCGVIAQEYGEDSKAASSKGYIDPMGALSALIRPSKRLAQATHDMLSDPFFSKVLGLKDAEVLPEGEMNQALVSPVATSSSFRPLFTASDRKTRVVASKDELYEPIGKAESRSPSTAEKIGMDKGKENQDRLKAELLLDTHPLISPAIGDWSKIKLKNGCLVTWGERERMAEDIEAWVDSVCRGVENEKDAPPGQDGASEPKQRAKASMEEGEEDANSWIESAVERGPGGVHAWPYVSMYLAGTEAERERGLDMLAEFVARLPSESTAAVMNQGYGYESKKDMSAIDPPHAAPDSPYSESASEGSMPSDVDLHGFVGEDEGDFHQRFQGPSHTVNIVDAFKKASEINARETLQQDSTTHGLGLSNDAGVPSPTVAPNVEQEEEDLDLTPSQALRPIRILGNQIHRVAPPQIVTERERGRSRSPRQTSNINTMMNAPSFPSEFISSVQLHRPGTIQTRAAQEPAAAQSVALLWWTSPVDNEEAQVERDGDGIEAEEVTLTQATDQTSRSPNQSLEDIMEVSSDEAFSPNRSISPPSQNEVINTEEEDDVDEEREAMNALASAPLDISYYGLSHYAIQRPEPEGLSDIAEEGSVLSASVTSAGENQSRSLSPVGNVRNQSPQTSLTAASMLMREQEWNSRWDRPRWPVEDDEEEEGNEGKEEIEGQLAFSPPAHPQPGPSLPLVHHHSGWKSTEDISSTMREPGNSRGSQSAQQSPSIGIARKKPKGDVWW